MWLPECCSNLGDNFLYENWQNENKFKVPGNNEFPIMCLITVSSRNAQTSEMEETAFPFTKLGALSHGTGRRLSSTFKSSPVLHESYFEVMFTFLDWIRFSGRDIWVLSAYFWLCLRMFILFNVGDLNSWQGTW